MNKQNTSTTVNNIKQNQATSNTIEEHTKKYKENTHTQIRNIKQSPIDKTTQQTHYTHKHIIVSLWFWRFLTSKKRKAHKQKNS